MVNTGQKKKKKKPGFLQEDEFHFDEVELGICSTSKWRYPKGLCPIWGN